MKIRKPTAAEKTIIAVVVSIAFGFFIGVLSMKEKLEQSEFERKILMYDVEELSEMNHYLGIIAMEKENK